MIWDEILLSICIACFWAGLGLTILFFILNVISFSHESSDVQSESAEDISHEITHDVAHEGAYDTDHEISQEFDHEIAHDLDHDLSDELATDISHEIEPTIDHDVDHDFTHEVNHDVAHAVEQEGTTEFNTVQSHESDNEIHHEPSLIEPGSEISIDFSGNKILNIQNHTPFMLLFSLYLLWFGVVGIFGYPRLENKYLWLGSVVILPILISKLISLIWRKIARNMTYVVEQGYELLGVKAVVKLPVTEEGGTISIPNSLYVHPVPAKSLYPLSKFDSDDEVYICDYVQGFYLIDSSPSSVKRYKLKSRTQSNTNTKK